MFGYRTKYSLDCKVCLRGIHFSFTFAFCAEFGIFYSFVSGEGRLDLRTQPPLGRWVEKGGPNYRVFIIVECSGLCGRKGRFSLFT